jgi:hypothetical protein
MAAGLDGTDQHEAEVMARGQTGVVGRVQLRNKLRGFCRSTVQSVKKDAAEDALMAAIIAKNTGQNVIATTPSSLSPGKVGRIWTGAMWEDFDAAVTQTGNKINIRYGWITRKQKYYMVQEHGGTAFGKDITPMHALVAAKVASENYLKDKGVK